MQTKRCNKLSLSCFGDKRFILDDAFTCLLLVISTEKDVLLVTGDMTTIQPTCDEPRQQGYAPCIPPLGQPTTSKLYAEGADRFLEQNWDEIIGWTSSDPGFTQSYSDSELNDDLADFDAGSEPEIPLRNIFIDDEAQNVDSETGSVV